MNPNKFLPPPRWSKWAGVIFSLFIWGIGTPATAQNNLNVRVTNISIAGELSARGLTAAFPHPVLATISVSDTLGNPILGLADTSQWLAPQDLAEIGVPVAQIWKRLFEYHRDNPAFPPNADIYQQTPAPLVTEFRKSTPFPTSTMLVMDVSGSMIEELPEAKDAARLFVDLLRPIDRAGVIQFSHTINAFQPITEDKQKLYDNIDSAQADGATAIYDALVFAVQKTNRENSRRAIIVYTDGVDISSTFTATAVIDSARFYSIPIFTIALGSSTNPDTLRRIANETGGIFFQTDHSANFPEIYQQIAALTRNFYMLAYSSPDTARNGTWRTLDVTVASAPGWQGRNTGEYFVPGAPPRRATNLGVTLASITKLTVVENGKIVNAVQPGDQYTYRLRVHNFGPERAESIRLNQLLPPAVSFLGATNLPYYTTNDSLVWQIARLDAGATDSITVTAQFAANAPPALTQLISRLTVFARNDNTPENNLARDTVRVVSSSAVTDLAVTLNSRTNSTVVENGRIVNAVKPGEPIEYKIRVRNLGPEGASNIRVRQLLPDSVRFVGASKTLSFTSNDSIVWQIPQLASGGVDSITVSLQFASIVPPALTQLISRADMFSPNDNSPANNSASDTIRVVSTSAVTDLAVTLNSRTNSTVVENGRIVNAVKPGEPMEYKIRVRNQGPEGASNIRVRQLLPDSVRFISASKTLSFTSKDSIIWQIAQLASGGVDSITVSLQFASIVPPALTRLISRADMVSPNDNSPANNSASDTIRVVSTSAVTDLAVTLNSRTNSTVVENGRIVNAVKPGEPIEYKIRVRNLGPEGASNIRVRQLLPDSVRFISASQPLAVASNDSLVWQIPQLASGGVDSITVSLQFASIVPPALTQLISRADMVSPNDNSPANNSASDTIRVVSTSAVTDLAVTLNSRTNSTVVENGRIVNAVKPGEPVEYKIRVRNHGPEGASNIRVRQLLPDSVRFISASQPLAVASNDSLVWQIAQLASGGVDSITVSLQFASIVPPALTRLISRADMISPNDNSPANNSAVDTIRVVNPSAVITDLSLALNSRTNSTVVENGRVVNAVKPGEPVEYKIRVRNHGPEGASNIRVRQLLPDSVRFISASQPLAVTSKDSVVWQIPQLASGGADSITVSLQFASIVPLALTRLISRADMSSPNDNSPANNSASDTIRVVNPSTVITDLSLALNSRTNSTIVENGRVVNAVKPGEPLEYKIRVRNHGPEGASNIRVRQLLPDSVRFVGASKTLSFTSKDSVVWQISQLASGGADSITVSLQFASIVPPALTRLISRADMFSPNDNSPANNSASDTIRVVNPSTVITDLSLALNSRTNSTIVENGRIVNAVKPGEPLEYKIRVRNQGPEEASNIRVRQLLPDSVRFVGASKTLSFASKDSVVWQIPQLASGSVDSITVSLQFASNVPPALTRLISRADMSSPNDNSPANNTATDTIRVVNPSTVITDLSLALNSRTNSTIVENGRIVNAVKPGEPVEYKIRVRNHGPEGASNIRVRQLLPDSVRFVGTSKILSFTSKDSIVWQIPQLASGGADSITVSLQFASNVLPALTRLISRADMFSPNDNSPANNSASDTIRVVNPSTVITDLSLALNSRTNSTIVENGRIVNAVKPGEPVEYKIRLRNQGPEVASNIRVRQLLPDSVRFVGASKTLSFVSKDSIVWQIAQLASGSVDSITVSLQFASNVPPALTQLVSRADMSSPNDNSPANNSASDTIRVVNPSAVITDLSLALNSRTNSTVVENGRVVNAVKPGEPVEYKIRVRNQGPEGASNIRVRQLLPDSVRFVGASKTLSFTSKDSVVWQIPQLNANGSDSIIVSLQFASNVPPALTRLISRADMFSPNDNSPANNSASDTIRVVNPSTVITDLSLALNSRTNSTIVENGRIVNAVKPGEPVEYKIRVRNRGPEGASNIRVRQLLPDSVRFVGASKTLSFTSEDSIVWQIPQLASGGVDSITVSLQFASIVPPALTRLISRADLSSPNDNSPANNVARDTIRVILPSPLVRPLIEARPPEVTIGDSVRVRVQVLAPINTWDLWVYYANGQIDSSYAEAYIKTTALAPNVWFDVTPIFTNTRLVTAAKEEQIRFEIRTRDLSGSLGTASASVLVRSSNDLVLEHNVFAPDHQPVLGINFRLSSNRLARLDVYDLNGVCITKLAEAPFNAGWNTYNWNGLTETGRPVGSGVYIIALRSGEFTAWKKCIIVR